MLYLYIYQKKKQEKNPTSFAIGEKICSVANCQKGQGKFLRIAVFQNHLCSSLSTVTDGYHLHVFSIRYLHKFIYKTLLYT